MRGYPSSWYSVRSVGPNGKTVRPVSLYDHMSTTIPKADLHLHSESAARIDRLLAERDGRAPYDWAAWAERLRTFPPGDERLARMNGEMDVDRLETLDSNRDLLVDRIAQAMNDSVDDGAVLVEIRFGRPTVYRADLVRAFREAERRARARKRRRPTTGSMPFFAEPLILAWPDDQHGERFVEACLALREQGLAGVDLLPVPYSDEAEWTAAYRWAERFALAGLGITAHGGEFTTANVGAALAVPGLARLGHGIQVVQDDRLLQRVIDQGVTLECCLTSNLVYGPLQSLDEHPIRRLVEAGVKVTLNSDCPVRLCTSIDREYELARRLGFDDTDLFRMTLNAVDASFTSEARREQILSWLGRL